MRRGGKTPVIVSPVYVNGTAVLRAFARLGGYCVAASPASGSMGLASRYADEKVALKGEPGELAQWLLARKDLYGGIVVPTGDEAVWELHAARGRLADKYRLAIPDEFACEVALNRDLLTDVARRASVPYPATIDKPLEEHIPDAGGLGFPVLVKPCYGIEFQRAFNRKLLRVHNADELARAFADCRRRSLGFILQAQVPEEGPKASYNGYVYRDGTMGADYSSRCLGIWPPKYGNGFMEVSEQIDQVMEGGRRLVRELKYAGAMVNLDFKQDVRTGVWTLLDFNARSWRQVSMAPAVGARVFEMLYRDYRDEGHLPAPRIKWGRQWLYLKEALLERRAYPAEAPSLLRYITMLANPRNHALFEWRDPRPFLEDMAPLLRRRLRKRTDGKPDPEPVPGRP